MHCETALPDQKERNAKALGYHRYKLPQACFIHRGDFSSGGSQAARYSR